MSGGVFQGRRMEDTVPRLPKIDNRNDAEQRLYGFNGDAGIQGPVVHVRQPRGCQRAWMHGRNDFIANGAAFYREEENRYSRSQGTAELRA